MPDYKDILKNGWHPDKDDTMVSLKGQMKKLVGRADKSDRSHTTHAVQPLCTLRDPASFGPPPKHVALTGGTPTPPPPRYTSASTVSAIPSPRLPPRISQGPLPPRLSNPSALSRLGTSGISLPSLGIPGSTNSFFSPSTATPLGPQHGTTLAQKQSALRTVSSVRRGESVSLSDAKSAASTLDNVRQRHGEPIVSGLRQLNALGQTKWEVQGQARGDHGGGGSLVGGGTEGVLLLAKKKSAPPPPPPKRTRLGRDDGDEAEPSSHVPMRTKPTF